MSSGGGVQIRWTGANFAALSRELKHADPLLRKEMSREIRAITKPIILDLRKAIMATQSKAAGKPGGHGSAWRYLYRAERSRSPLTDKQKANWQSRAGLRTTIARGIRASQRDRGHSVGVEVRASTSVLPPDQRKLPRHMNEGSWRHPVMGNRKAWVTQTVTPTGWFTNTVREHWPRAIRELNHTLDRYVVKLAHRIEAAAG